MCEKLRKRFEVPDDWVKDTHLTNWFCKNFSDSVLAVFVDDKERRGTLTKTGFGIGMMDILVCFNEGHSVLMSCSEFMTFKRYD